MDTPDATGVTIRRATTVMDPADVADATAALTATFTETAVRAGVYVVDGFGVTVRVDRGHLEVNDGIGRHRRTRRWSRADQTLRRLLIVGRAGTISLDAVRWCTAKRIAVVIVDTDGTVHLGPGERSPGDARLRRAQAASWDTPAGLVVVRHLLGAKLAGHASIAAGVLDRPELAAAIDDMATAAGGTTTVDEARGIEAVAAAAYFAGWRDHPATTVRFATKDRRRVPAHWSTFDTRGSTLGSGNANRKAERPLNAILNYLYALAEVECVVACRAVGLDSGLGVLHADATGRDSMALDLLEVVRPAVERWALGLVARRHFVKADFSEADNGHVRVLAPLTHELAATMGTWGKTVGRHAEKVAHLLTAEVAGVTARRTPLTGANLAAAQDRVRERKTALAVDLASRSSRNAQEGPRSATCVDCGGPLARGVHRRCSGCWDGQAGQDETTRQQRGKAIAEALAERTAWKAAHPEVTGDADWYRQVVLPGLATVKLATIIEAIGVAKSTASAIRSGRRLPALRHWTVLAELTGAG